MSTTFKQLIATIIVITAIGMAYFGAYLPLRKGQMQIDAVINLQSGKVRNIDDLNGLFNPVLDFYSPIGQDELTQYYLGILINIINQQTEKQVIDVLIKQAEGRMAPILEKGTGFSFNQNLYTFGSIYKIAALKFHDLDYYQKAINIFQMGLKYSPNRSIFLKGLFELYSANKDDQTKALEIGKTILEYYPNETKVREFVESMKS